MLTLNDAELIDIEKIFLDEEIEGAIRFLRTYLDKQEKTILSGERY